MMSTCPSQNRFVTLALALLLLLAVSCARADPPARVARLSYASGLVSFSPAGETDWVDATLNRPLTTGDRLWADANSRAEFQIGGAAVHLGASTNLTLTRLDDEMAQIELSQGSLKVRVRSIGSDQSFEVNTPNLSFSLNQAGDYRIDVDPRGAATVVKVKFGQAVVVGERSSYTINAGQAYRFYGTALSAYESLPPAADDGLDRWSDEREWRTANSESARYVSNEVVGYEDLDAHGYWRADPVYGNVWWPNQLPVGWTPYRNGHWTWIDPWGWNWVDDAPWGYAVSHYGRWAHLHGSWCWVPGPRHERAVFAPALVVFLSSDNFRGSRSVQDIDGEIAWFPLAPREVYLPAYQVSRSYFDRVNRSNAQISSVTLVNVYQTNITQVIKQEPRDSQRDHMNRRVAGAVVAAPVRSFIHSEPVAKTGFGVAKEFANRGLVTPFTAIAPAPQSRTGGASEARSKPPVFERRILARPTLVAPAMPAVPQRSPLADRPVSPVHGPQGQQLDGGRLVEPHRGQSPQPMTSAPVPAASTAPMIWKKRPPTEPEIAGVQVAPVLAPPPGAARVKALPNVADTAPKPMTQSPARIVRGDDVMAAQARRAKDEAAKAAAVQQADEHGNKIRAMAAQVEAARLEAERAKAAQAAVSKGVAQPSAPQAHPSEARVIRKQVPEVR